MASKRARNPFDDTTRTAQPPPADGEHNEVDHAYLLVLAGASLGEMYKVDKPKTVLGRGERVDIRLVDEGISREHAQLVREPDHVILEDLGSTNGTFCNGVRVKEQILADGDKILLGSTTILKFTYHDKLDEAFQRQLSESALRDGLTKAFNKRYFGERLESEVTFSIRHRVPLSLIFLDIDHFKRINDTHGHPGGDAILVELAAVITEGLRGEDILARYGGEEFAIVCRETELREAAALAERLRAVVEGHSFLFEDNAVPVTISVGVAAMPDPAAQTGADLVALADETMYKAKRGGRNRVCVREVRSPPQAPPVKGPSA
ncbi:MAG TPA: GGDEF domain-containing protein [Polyangia bacterium]|nr:GGDEF domain-containing protein [Polyangia bacterium]